MPSKVERIIEYQENRQRSPLEALEFLKDEVAKGNCTHMIVLYRDGEQLAYVPASDTRDYSKAAILWHFEQWKQWFLNHENT
jgi:hypothetical protein